MIYSLEAETIFYEHQLMSQRQSAYLLFYSRAHIVAISLCYLFHLLSEN